MRNRWAIALAVGSLWAARQANAGPSGPSTSDVLDRLSVPAVSASWPADNVPAVTVPVSAAPIAVPTPTAAESGLVLIAGLIGCRVVRRVARGA